MAEQTVCKGRGCDDVRDRTHNAAPLADDDDPGAGAIAFALRKALLVPLDYLLGNRPKETVDYFWAIGATRMIAIPVSQMTAPMMSHRVET
jgi:hypothetical protein